MAMFQSPSFSLASSRDTADSPTMSTNVISSVSESVTTPGGVSTSRSESVSASSSGNSSLCSSTRTPASKLSQTSKLSNKFEELEKRWSLYNRFGDLEKKWSKFSSTVADAAVITSTSTASNAHASRPVVNGPTKVVKIEDLEQKWAQLHAFATQEKQLVQRQHDQEHDETRDDTTDHGVPTDAKTNVDTQREEELTTDRKEPEEIEKDDDGSVQWLEDDDEADNDDADNDDDKPQHEKATFVIKRRGAKRPRRMLALTKVKRWNFGSASSKPDNSDNNAFHDKKEDDDQESGEEEIDFVKQKSTTVKVDDEDEYYESDGNEDHCDDSGDSSDISRDSSALSRLTRRILISMPNKDLWETYHHETRSMLSTSEQDECRNPGGISSSSSGESWDDQREQETILFSSSMEYAPDSTCRTNDYTIDTLSEGRDTAGFQSVQRGDSSSRTGVMQRPAMLCVSPLASVSSSNRIDALQPVLRDMMHSRRCTASAVLIQSWVRMHLAKIQSRQMCAPCRAAENPGETRRRRDFLSPTVARIQTLRKFQVIERSRKNVVLIQSLYRGWLQRSRYLKLQTSVLKVQHVFRMFLSQRNQFSAAVKIQRNWLMNRQEGISAQWGSFDGSGISTLSFDNSYQYDDSGIPFPTTTPLPIAVSIMDPGNPVATSPLPPLHPTSPHYHHTPPSLARPISPASCSSSPSPSSSHRRGEVPLKHIHTSLVRPIPPASRSLSPTASRRQKMSPAPRTRSGRLANLRNHRLSVSPLKQRGVPLPQQSAPSGHKQQQQQLGRPPSSPSKRKPPLANIITDFDDGKPTEQDGTSKRCLRNIPDHRSPTLKAKPQHHHHERKHSRSQDFDLWGESVGSKLGGRRVVSDSELECAATIVENAWRRYRAQLKRVGLVLRACRVSCEYSNGRVARNRQLRAKAQLLSISKAIGQVGHCVGATERLAVEGHEIVCSWTNIVYISVEATNGEFINTFTDVVAEARVQKNSMQIASLSRRRLFVLAIKASLQQHMLEQKEKVSRNYLLEKAQRRRRAPLERDAAITIQRFCRGSAARFEFNKKRQSIIIIQTWWMKKYALRQTSALVVQRNIRRSAARKEYTRKRKSAIMIQAFFRAELIRAIIFDQFFIVSWTLRNFWNKQRRDYIAEVDARVVALQAAFRGNRQRKRFLVCLSASLKLQATIRMMLARKRLLKRIQHEEDSAKLLQQWWRFEAYNMKMRREASIILQASLRRYRLLKRFQCLREAAVTVQRIQRGHMARKKIQQERYSSMQVQSTFRGWLARAKLSKMIEAGIKLQAWFRGSSQRQAYLKRIRHLFVRESCAIILQAQWRRFTMERQYNYFLLAVIILQIQTRKMIFLRRNREAAAATLLQSQWRRVVQRGRFLQARNRVVAVQATYRRLRQQRIYQEMKVAGIMIQAQWRCHCGVFNFHIHRGACIFLQRTWRNYRFLQEIKGEAATLLQTFVRTQQAMRAFSARKFATHCIQRVYRGSTGRRESSRRLQNVVRLQSFWRRVVEESAFSLLRRLAILSQACGRGWLQRRKYRLDRQRVINIQCLMKLRFKMKTFNVVRIQSTHRAYIQRKKFLHCRACAVKIQCLARSRLLRKNSSAAKIQSVQRAYVQRKVYLYCLSSAEKIQNHVRNRLRRKNSNASMIQSLYRAFIKRREFLRYRSSVIKAQSLVKRRNDLRNHAAARLQRWWRCYISSFKYVITHFSIVLIQAQWRKHHLKLLFSEKRDSALLIQAHWRAHKQREFQRIERALVLFQLQFRRKCFLKRRIEAACTLQRFARHLECRKRGLRLLKEKRRANRVLHVRTRRKERSKSFRERQSASAIVIQKFWRGRVLERKSRVCRLKQIRQRRKTRFEQSCAAEKIQRNWRRYNSKRKLMILKEAGNTLVCRARAVLDGRIDRSKFLQTRGAIVTVQRYSRGYLSRKYVARLQSRIELVRERIEFWQVAKSKAAMLIQNVWRKYRSRQKRKAAIVVQRQWRRYLALCTFTKLKNIYASLNALTLQQQVFRRRVHSAICLQRQWRCVKYRRSYTQKRKAVLLLQKRWRQRQTKKSRELARIQSWWRRHCAQSTYRQLQKNTVLIQSCWRMKSRKMRFLQLRRCSIRLQRKWRKKPFAFVYKRVHASLVIFQHEARCFCRRRSSAATILQAQWRMISCLCRYQRFLSKFNHIRKLHYWHLMVRVRSARVVQRWWRASALGKKETASACLIQKAYFGFQERRKRNAAAIQIQTCFRSSMARFKLLIKIICATIIQSVYRGHRQRLLDAEANELEQSRRSIVRIQCQWRSFLRKRAAAQCMQSHWKRWLYKSRYAWITNDQALFAETRQSIITIQSIARGHLARKQHQSLQQSIIQLKCSQAAIRGWLIRLRLKQQACAVTEIAATWRAHYSKSVFVQKREAAILIQTRLRGWLSKQHFKGRKIAAQQIQAAWGTYQGQAFFGEVSQSMFYKHLKTVHLQSCWRRNKAQMRYRCIRGGMVILQQRWKTRVSQRVQAATLIQSYARRAGWESYFRQLRLRTILLQAFWRKFSQYQNYLRLKAGVHALQRRREMAATLIQSHLRGWLSKKSYRQKKEQGCVVTQRSVRTQLWAQKFKDTREAAKILQAFFRRYLSSTPTKTSYDPSPMKRSPAQSTFKKNLGLACGLSFVSWMIAMLCSTARMLVKAEHSYVFKFARHCCGILQILGLWYIYKQIRNKQNETAKRMTKSIIVLQRCFRRKRLKNQIGDGGNEFRVKLQKIEIMFERLKECALNNEDNASVGQNSLASEVSNATSQCFPFLACQMLFEDKAASRIQRCYRLMLKKKRASIVIQKKFRCWKERSQRRSASFVASRDARSKELLVHRFEILNTLVLQRWYRTCQARSAYQEDLNHVQLIGMDRLRCILERHAANCIVRWWRVCQSRIQTAVSEQDSYVSSFDASSIVTTETGYAQRETQPTTQLAGIGITETESGLEVVPVDANTATDLNPNPMWCGFETFLPLY